MVLKKEEVATVWQLTKLRNAGDREALALAHVRGYLVIPPGHRWLLRRLWLEWCRLRGRVCVFVRPLTGWLWVVGRIEQRRRCLCVDVYLPTPQPEETWGVLVEPALDLGCTYFGIGIKPRSMYHCFSMPAATAEEFAALVLALSCPCGKRSGVDVGVGSTPRTIARPGANVRAESS